VLHKEKTIKLWSIRRKPLNCGAKGENHLIVDNKEKTSKLLSIRREP